jgi:hypothetical protein
VSEWQPIETAPKGWRIWIIVSRVNGPVWMARWYENDRYRNEKFEPIRAYWTDSDELDWPSTFDGEEDFITNQPTHWMPLPEPPRE